MFHSPFKVAYIKVNPASSRSSPRRILAIVDWDFGGSHVLPFADHNFELSSPDSDQDAEAYDKQGDELFDSHLHINRLVGAPPEDRQLTKLVYSTKLYILDIEAKKAAGENTSGAC